MLISVDSKATDPLVDSLRKLGRDALIDLAIQKVNDKSFDPSSYDRVIVKANDSTLLVEFTLSVVVYKDRSCFCDKLTVALVGKGSGKSFRGFCNSPGYYKKTKSDQEKIDFVFSVINEKNELRDFPDGKLPLNTTMEIHEDGRFLYVVTNNFAARNAFRLDRLTREISGEQQQRYRREQDQENQYEILH